MDSLTSYEHYDNYIRYISECILHGLMIILGYLISIHVDDMNQLKSVQRG